MRLSSLLCIARPAMTAALNTAVVTLVAMTLSTPTTAEAQVGSSLTLLARRTVNVSPSGKMRTTDCSVTTSEVITTHVIDGIQITTRKSVDIQGAIAAKIDEAASATAEVKKGSPIEFSYWLVAYRASSSGIQESVDLGSYDGTKGEETFNPSIAAMHLKEVLKAVCD